MPVFALYNFNDNSTVVDDAPINGIQNGIYVNGASASGGDLLLDGVNDFAKIYPASQFQMPQGTLEINFTPTGADLTGPQTVLSRDSAGENGGSYRVEVYPDGSVQITHETEGGSTTFTTGPDFYSPGDTINLSYSWDQGGTGGQLVIENTTTGGDFTADVPSDLTMDMADQNQPWIIGASQDTSDPDILNNIDEHFQGSVEFFSLSDTVDNNDDDEGENSPPEAEGDTASTIGTTPVVIDVLTNDTDINGDTLVINGTPTSADGTIVVNPDNTLTFTANPGFTGDTTFLYTVDDGNGGSATSFVTVTVNPDVLPGRDGIVTGTTGDDLIDLAYIDPTDADRVDANDALLPGEVGNDDIIRAGDGNDTVLASLGNDEVEAGGGDDSVNGGLGNDSLEGQAGDDSIFGDEGNDTIEGDVGDDEIVGGIGNDSVVGGDGNDELQGNDGQDTISGGAGNDTARGGEGNDVIDTGIAGSPDRGFPGLFPADANPDDDRDLVIASFGDDRVTTGDDADSLFGGDGNDRLESGVDDDTVDGGMGNDTIIAGEGNDTVGGGDNDDLIFGGDGPGGTDTTEIPDATDPDVNNNRDSLSGGIGNDTIYGQDDDDTITGGSGNDLVFGGIDEDSIIGGSGDDDLRGGEGADTIDGGDGSDTVFGQQDNDVIDTSGGVTPLPDAGYPGVYPSDTDPENDRDSVSGGLGNDTIRTGDDADTIFGDDGVDLIDAGVDDDSVFGGQGGDTIVGNEGDDTIDGGSGADLIYGGLNDVLGDALDIADDAGDLRPDNNRDVISGGTGDDTIFGRDDDDTIDGGAGADLIDGGVDEDSILGGTGNDTVTGSAGADTSAGGADRDTFVIGSQDTGIGDFIDGNEEGDDFDTLDLSAAGPLSIVYDPANAENGVVTFLDTDGNATGTLTFINIENVINPPDPPPPPCFTPGTLIATPKGEVPVESLKPGDKVITRDNGIQEIRWIGQTNLSGQELRLNSHLQPVLIKAHSLGNGLPEQDMLVSPNHRLLVANDRTQLYFDEHEVLVAAKHLVGTTGVHAVASIGVCYIHFMCDRHEVVLSNGSWTESFQPGDMTLKGMGNSQRNEIFELFPELKTEDGLQDYQAARRTLKRHEAKLLVK